MLLCNTQGRLLLCNMQGRVLLGNTQGRLLFLMTSKVPTEARLPLPAHLKPGIQELCP